MPPFDVYLPTGPGFRLVHRINQIDKRSGVVKGLYDYKDGTTWHAHDHFPNLPIMPGVKQLSIMIETACLSFTDSYPVGLVTIQDVRFSGRITPGAKLTVNAMAKQEHGDAKVFCELKSNGKTVTMATLIFAKKIVKSIEPVIMPFDYTGKEIWQSENGFMPPEMVIECMAENMIQVMHVYPELKDKLFLFQGIRKAEFGPDICPGSTLELTSIIHWIEEGRRGTADCTAIVNQEKVAEATIEFAIINHRMIK